MPEITVVIPVYNVEKYVEKCVKSIALQSCENVSVVLVNDGSTDNSGAICDRLAAEYSNVKVMHQTNKGLGGARNTGIENCKTDYIMFLDSDDCLTPDTLKICANIISSNQCDMVLFDMLSVYDDGSKGVKYTVPVIPDKLLSADELKPLAFYSGACNRVYKTKLFKETGIRFPEKVWYEDLRTVPLLVPYVKNVYYYSKKPLYFYLQRRGSIMHTPDFDRVVTERMAAVDTVVDYYMQNGIYDKYHEELDYLRIFHGFFLPVREMQSMSGNFMLFADSLQSSLLKNCPEPFKNKYISELSTKEKQMLKLFVNRKYKTVRLLALCNKLIKKLTNTNRL